MARITKTPEERKREITEAALELFSQKGYDNTTTKDLAKKLNISEGLCYKYFKSKQEIFAAASDAYAHKFVQSISLNKNISPKDNLILVLRQLFKYSLKHIEFESAYQREAQISTMRIQKISEQIADIVIPIIEQGNNDGSFDCKDVENTTRFLMYGATNLIHYKMPLKESENHIISYIPSIEMLCKKLLGIKGDFQILVGRNL